MLVAPGVAKDADHLVAVAERVGIHVALGSHDRASVLGPPWPCDPAIHQLESGTFGLDRLSRCAEAGYAGQQRERRGAALLSGIADEALADQFLDIGRPPGWCPPVLCAASWLLPPPGAEQFADHKFRV